MKLMKMYIQKVNNLLFLDEEEVAIVLQGKVTIYSYKTDPHDPKVIASYGPGSVIGDSSIDNGTYRYPEHWSHIEDPVELCIFTRSDFKVLCCNEVVCVVYAEKVG